jgi:membrane protease YdiL (CAAX protease family)
MEKMAVESKISPEALPASRRLFVWAQIIVAFLFIELALWAPTRPLRNQWAGAAAIAILIFVAMDALIDPPSLTRLGLRLPTLSGAVMMLGIGLAAAVFLMAVVHLAGGPIPANPTWFPGFQTVWGYALWALIQEFILQSFFFTRFEELFGGAAAVWIAATLFATAHLPSPVLTVGTLIGALFFCEMFRRYRSTYLLGVVHAMLGLTIAMTMPDSVLHHMRVGMGYLRYHH